MTITVTRDGPIAVVAFDRPGAKNAFTMAMRKQLCDAFDALQEEAEVRAVILTGTGGDFCSGADIGEMGDTPPEDFVGRMHRLHRMTRSIARFRTPVIAAVDGVCIGAAWGFALAADIVLATPETRFSASFRKIGYAPDAGLTWQFLRQMGAMRAKEIVYTGRIVTGVEAFDLGLALELVSADGLMDRAVEMAMMIADGPATALHLAKRQFAAAPSLGLDAFLDFELTNQPLLGQTDDHREAVAAFRAKRPAVFRDR